MHSVQDLQSQLLLWLRRLVNFDLAIAWMGESVREYGNIQIDFIWQRYGEGNVLQIERAMERFYQVRDRKTLHMGTQQSSFECPENSIIQSSTLFEIIGEGGFRNNRSNITKYALIAPYYHISDVSSAIWVEHRKNRQIRRKGSYKGRNAKNRVGEMTKVVARI